MQLQNLPLFGLQLAIVLLLIGQQSAQCTEQSPDEATTHVKSGEAAAEKCDWEGAVSEFQIAIKLTDTNPIAYYDLGIAEFHLGNLEAADIAEKRAIKLDSHLIDAYVQLAAVRTKAEDYTGAEQILEKAVKLDPACESAKTSLNELCKLKKQSPELFKKRKESGLSELNDDTNPTIEAGKVKHSS